MRIATWNLDRCRPRSFARVAKLSALMAGLDIDVWVLTETHRDFRPRSGFDLVTHSADAPDRDTGRGECWVAVWSRLPAGPVVLAADAERTAAAQIGETTVVGTVLPWLSDDRDPALSGEAAFRARLAEQAADWRRLKLKGGLCIAGDFNQDLLEAGHYYGSAGGRAALRGCWFDMLPFPSQPPPHRPAVGETERGVRRWSLRQAEKRFPRERSRRFSACSGSLCHVESLATRPLW